MAVMGRDRVLVETFGDEGAVRIAKQVLLVALGVAALAIAAKIKVPMWPVPATLQTFVVLSIGASYGMRLGLVTLVAYLAVGALGFDVFTGSSAEVGGLSYMLGATGGYLVGFAVAAGAMGALARAGWDRSVGRMALAMLIGNAIIYLFGVPWMAYLFLEDRGLAWVMQWGMTNFLVFDALKLALAALLFPALWKLVGDARR
ncbi:biotin transporter BioY [Aestuariibius sp. 2305UL40-4]|uniref:biotin transporter BioY n=1 Tax=Aestuariibius violaceus TaxID=3234132 RepID=UPI00345EEFD9